MVYPSGTGFPKRWRTGDDSEAVKDVTFISDLIDQLSAEYNIDPARIYANGISNGGGMSFLLSCRLSERIAAFGSVAGAYNTPWAACNPSRPVPAILFHGTADPIVPYQGGPAGPSGSIFPSIPAWVAEFARRNGCDASPQDLPASGDVSGVSYNAASPTWSSTPSPAVGIPGPAAATCRNSSSATPPNDIDASRTMWDFFQQHPLHP